MTPYTKATDATTRRPLSSRWTFVQKWLFPFVWITGFGFVTFLLVRHPEMVVFNGVAGGASPTAGRLFVGAWVAGTAFVVASVWRVKRVCIEGDDLLVSNYLREIRVPLASVRDVRIQPLPLGTVVTVEFNPPTPLGRRIRFSARSRPPWGGPTPPLEDDMQKLLSHRAPTP
jgi:hypothetical protein